MRPLIQEIRTPHEPEVVIDRLWGEPGIVLLRSSLSESMQARYSFVVARPFLTFRSFASCCELNSAGDIKVQFGDPWRLLDALMSRYELLDHVDLPFPLGGCFGYWGYDLKNFVEPKLPRRAENELDLPDCNVGFYDSVVVFDHRLGKTWIVSTGLSADGSRTEERARRQMSFWREILESAPETEGGDCQSAANPQAGRARLSSAPRATDAKCGGALGTDAPYLEPRGKDGRRPGIESLPQSNLSRAEFLERVKRAQAYIRAGDIYQVNLSHRMGAPFGGSGWDLFQRLSAVSPAPFSAYLDCGDFEIASSSPEMFLRLSGSHIQTRPIKGTRPRSKDPTRDAQLSYELQTSAKEMAELVMITDLLRNDLGRVCAFGSVQEIGRAHV